MDAYGQNNYQQQTSSLQFITNSSADEMDALIGNGESNSEPKFKFDENRYLNTRLEPGEVQRVTTVRLLPISADSPKMFAQAKTHSLRVPTRIAKSGFKSYICLEDPNIPGYDPNVKCPICAKARELFAKAREYNPKDINARVEMLVKQSEQMRTTGNIAEADRIIQQDIPAIQSKADEDISKAIFKEACSYNPKKTYYTRVIERGKEKDGPKWWRFNENTDHDGIYDKLVNIYKQTQKEMRDAGLDEKYNIFDLVKGRDFVLTFVQKTETSKSGQTRSRVKIQLAPSMLSCPLTNNAELGNKWLADTMKWSDCYAIKTADYLSAVVDGKIPKKDPQSGRWYGIDPYETGAQQTANTVQQTQQAVTQYAQYMPPQSQVGGDVQDLPF